MSSDERGARSRREVRANAWISLLLGLAVLVLANRWADRHLRWRRDLSQDQLYTLSPVTRAELASLEGTVALRAFFTGKIRSGPAALAKARVEELLSEFETLSGGHLTVDVVDPSTSSRALAQAQDYGIAPREVQSLQGTTSVIESLYLGLVLRYRGREEVLPIVSPRTLEVEFVGALHRLTDDQPTRVGWVVDATREDSPAAAALGTFRLARARLEARAEVRSLELQTRVESGLEVPDDLDLVVVPRARLSVQACAALARFVRAGGRLLLCADDFVVDAVRGVHRLEGGYETLLRPWSALPTPEHVWDEARAFSFVDRRIDAQGATVATRVEYPLFLDLTREELSDQLAPTAGLDSAQLFWAQPIAPLEPPPGVERQALLSSSPDAYRVAFPEAVVTDPELVQGMTRSLYAGGKGRSYDLAVALEGVLPWPFEELAEAAQEAPLPSRVAVFGDADWIRDGYLSPHNARLYDNVVDWLASDESLLALRARAPRDRSLIDFEDAERRRLGLLHSGLADNLAELDRNRVLAEEAAARARRRRWLSMFVPTAVSLAVLVLIGLVWRAWEARSSWSAGRADPPQREVERGTRA